MKDRAYYARSNLAAESAQARWDGTSARRTLSRTSRKKSRLQRFRSEVTSDRGFFRFGQFREHKKSSHHAGGGGHFPPRHSRPETVKSHLRPSTFLCHNNSLLGLPALGVQVWHNAPACSPDYCAFSHSQIDVARPTGPETAAAAHLKLANITIQLLILTRYNDSVFGRRMSRNRCHELLSVCQIAYHRNSRNERLQIDSFERSLMKVSAICIKRATQR